MFEQVETCREWLEEDADRCRKPAEYILWGKLFDPEALGPRCYEHTAKWVGWSAMSMIDQYAVFDLTKVRRV